MVALAAAIAPMPQPIMRPRKVPWMIAMPMSPMIRCRSIKVSLAGLGQGGNFTLAPGNPDITFLAELSGGGESRAPPGRFANFGLPVVPFVVQFRQRHVLKAFLHLSLPSYMPSRCGRR
jgi:hypothetical protein